MHGASSSHGGTPEELDELASAEEEEELDASAELDELDSADEEELVATAELDELDSSEEELASAEADELLASEAEELDSSLDEAEERSSAKGARSPSRMVVACIGVVAVRLVFFRVMFWLPVPRPHAGYAGAVRVCVSRH